MMLYFVNPMPVPAMIVALFYSLSFFLWGLPPYFKGQTKHHVVSIKQFSQRNKGYFEVKEKHGQRVYALF